MPGPLTTLFALLSGAVLVTPVQGQDPGTPAPVPEGPCSACHLCENPTPQNRCLRACVRAEVRERARKRAPDVIILDELEDLYLPVPFDHKGHAEMAEMTRGCAVCHHYTPEGAEHPACKTCHEIAPKKRDIRKPGLKGAYHRQCMSCHREWSHATACQVCHPPKAGQGERGGPTTRPTKDDIVGAMHPPIPEPDVEIYQTKHKYMPGTKVIFRHKAHIHRFGLKCVECHREDNCLRCHEEGKKHTQRVKTLAEHHRPCSGCHIVDKDEACDNCHFGLSQPPPKPFNHAATGWPLGKYHAKLGCRTCHERVPFRKLDRNCATCHTDWGPETFDHGNVTGLALDETHREIDCEECHIERKFAQPPSCEECHDQDITYPASVPGKALPPAPGDNAKAKADR